MRYHKGPDLYFLLVQEWFLIKNLLQPKLPITSPNIGTCFAKKCGFLYIITCEFYCIEGYMFSKTTIFEFAGGGKSANDPIPGPYIQSLQRFSYSPPVQQVVNTLGSEVLCSMPSQYLQFEPFMPTRTNKENILNKDSVIAHSGCGFNLSFGR